MKQEVWWMQSLMTGKYWLLYHLIKHKNDMRTHAALQTEAIAVDCFELSNLRFKGLNLFDAWIFKGLI